MATVAQPLVPFEEYSQTGVCVPVPPDKLDVRFTDWLSKPLVRLMQDLLPRLSVHLRHCNQNP
jgi:hypothetical protein